MSNSPAVSSISATRAVADIAIISTSKSGPSRRGRVHSQKSADTWPLPPRVDTCLLHFWNTCSMVQSDLSHRVQPGTVGVPTPAARDHFDQQKIAAPSAQQCPCGIFSLRGCSISWYTKIRPTTSAGEGVHRCEGQQSDRVS